MQSILNIFVFYFSYYCNSCYFCYKMKCLLFFLIFCYQMKFPGVLNTNLTLSFLYMHYSCHTSRSKYIGLIWTTQYSFHCAIEFRFFFRNGNSISRKETGSIYAQFCALLLSHNWVCRKRMAFFLKWLLISTYK